MTRLEEICRDFHGGTSSVRTSIDSTGNESCPLTPQAQVHRMLPGAMTKDYIIKEGNGQAKETPSESIVTQRARGFHPEDVKIILEIETIFLYKACL